MAQWIKAIAAKPDDLSESLHSQDRKNRFPKVVL